MTPALILFGVLIAGPLVWGISLGFFKVRLISLERTFVGFDNFVRVWNAELFRAIQVSLTYTITGLLLQIVIGVSVALLMNKAFFGRSLARSLVIFPYLFPVVVATIVWTWMLDPTYGIINQLLLEWGILDETVAWLSDPFYALTAVILISTWHHFPFVVIAVLGRLQNIPSYLYDAAKADGAGAWSMFWDVTFPALRPVLIITIFLRFIWDINEYSLVVLLTGGGPAGATTNLPILIQQFAFGRQNLGQAAAIADVTFMMLIIFFMIYFWTVRPLEEK
ncbi:MAG: sugar ABC transporter permease [Proteobacteria bacterium]|nr:sugar ABC transporter permease [Pseudomonadota bacterium]